MAILGKSKIEELEVGTGQSSSSSTTGAEVVHGGLGVEENLNVGGNLSAGNIEQTLTEDSSKIPSSKAVYDSTIKNITADGEKVSADADLEVEVTEGENRTTNLHFKIPSGEDGQSPYFMVLNTYNVGLPSDEDGNLLSPTIGEIATLKIFHGNEGEDLSTWTLSGGVNSGTVSTPTVSADGKISITSLTSDLAILNIVATKGDISLDQSLRVAKIKSGTSPYILSSENDSYLFMVSGGPTPVLEEALPCAVSGIRILRGNEEQPFTVGTGTGWVVSAVFAAVVDSSAVSDTSLFNGDILSDGTVRVTTLSPTIQYGEISITAVNTTLSQSLTSTVSVRLQRAAGFGTPTASAVSSAPGGNASVSVSASGEETNKIFSFDFTIPRGENPLFVVLNPWVLPIAVNSNGTTLVSEADLPYIVPKVYNGAVEETGWSFTASVDPSLSSNVVVAVDGDNNIAISSIAQPGSLPSVFTINVTAIKETTTLTGAALAYKLYTTAGPAGATGPQGKGIVIQDVNVTLSGDTSGGAASATGQAVLQSSSSTENNEYDLNFTFNNIKPKLYTEISTAIDGAITPNAVRAALSQMAHTKAVYHTEIAANTTLSSYTVPNYTAGQDIEVYYNGLRLLEGSADQKGMYTFDSSTSIITFNSALGGTSLEQQLVIVARTLSSGGN